MKNSFVNLSIETLLHHNSHLGEKKNRRNGYQSAGILGHREGNDVINLGKSLKDLTPVLHIITETVANRESVLVIAQDSGADAKGFPQPIITNKWVYGALSNFKMTKHSKKNPLKEMPNALILLKTNTSDLLLNEAKFLEIPTITVQQTGESPLGGQYTVLANKNDGKTVQLLLRLLAKAAFYGYSKEILRFRR
jgi:ribosomal protein S2